MRFYIFSKRSASSLSVVSVQATDIPPKELVTYTKQTQTASTGGVERDGMYFPLFIVSMRIDLLFVVIVWI